MQILRAVPRAHLDVEREQVVGREIESRAKTLDLQRPRELAAEAMGDTVGCDHEEGEEGEHDDSTRYSQADERLATPAAAPDVGDGERDEHRRIELHGDRRPEHAEAKPVAAVDERRERADDEGGRVEIEAREHDRTEQQREAREQGERRGRPRARGANPVSATAASSTAATPQAAISHSKTSRKPSWSSLRSAGRANAGSAPGGYSGRMSR